MIRNFLLISTAVLSLTTAACTSSPVEQQVAYVTPELTFEHLTDIPVNVSDIVITSDTQRGSQAWDVANNMQTPPDVAMQRYLRQRYKAVGADGVLTMNLAKANLYYSEVPHSNSLLSYIPFANEQEHTFEVVVEMENKYLSGLPDRKTSTRFVRRVKMPPHVTMSYREAKLQRAMELLIRDIDEAITSTLVHEFQVVSPNKVPVKAMPLKSAQPKMETIYSQEGAVVADPMDGDTEWITTRDTNE